MKRLKILSVLICLALVSCATIQERWNALTPDEKARIIINDLQTQLETLWNKGKDYVNQNPQYSQIWRDEIVPAFSTANTCLKTVIMIAQTRGITPDQVYSYVQPALDKIMFYLIKIGALK